MPSAGFEPAIPAGKRLQTLALDRSATGIGSLSQYLSNLLLYDELETMCKNVVLLCYKLLPQDFRGETEKTQQECVCPKRDSKEIYPKQKSEEL